MPRRNGPPCRFLRLGSAPVWIASIGVRLAARLALAPASFDAGAVAPGQTTRMSLHVTNLTDRTVRLVGGTSSCSCVATETLPADCPAMGAIDVPVVIRAPVAGKTVHASVSLFSDLANEPPLTASLTISGAESADSANKPSEWMGGD